VWAERGETFNVGLERKIIGQSAGGGHQNRLWQLCQVIEIFETTTGKFIRFEIRFCRTHRRVLTECDLCYTSVTLFLHLAK
jgi:hypothetical protein